MVKTAGQTLIERIESFIGRYVGFPAERKDQTLLLALWTLHTWIFERFSATPYLTINANTMQAGKTLCLEVLMMVSRGPEFFSTLRPLALVRAIGMHDRNLCSLFLDEAEKMSGAGLGDLRSIFTSGYRFGGRHGISVGKKMEAFTTYCPKAFALIGDVMDVIRDRSLPIQLQRMTTLTADFYAERVEAEIEAERIKALITLTLRVPERVAPDFLQGRDQEIATVLWSLAVGLGLDAATLARFRRVLVDACEAKKAPARKFTDAAAEEKAVYARYSERALRDLVAVMHASETDVFSAVAVDRMKLIDAGPWRTYRGVGLDVDTLARLVSPFNITPKNVRMVKGKGAKLAEMLKGYKRDTVLAAGEAAGVKIGG